MNTFLRKPQSKFLIALGISFLLFNFTSFSQDSDDDNAGEPFLNLVQNKDAKFKFILMSQFWLRHTDMNPGTTINGEPTDQFTDISIRRLRIFSSMNLNDRWYFKLQIGCNNINHINSQTPLRILDLETSYKFSDEFIIGGGKNGHVGLSRYASPSSFSALGFDLAFFAMPTVGVSDEILRKLSIYAKGNLGKVAYRAVMARPQLLKTESSLSDQSSFRKNLPAVQYSAYFAYQFFNKESNVSAYRASTYHGKKKVLNLGAGFMYQSDALAGLDISTSDTVTYDMLHLAVDLFIDMPLSEKQSFTTYLGYFDYDFGKNYIRNAGVNNPANGQVSPTFHGFGNKLPTTGTGQVIFGEMGFMQQTDRLKSLEGIQPFGSLQYANYEALNDPMIMYNLGLNFIFDGHNSKLSIGAQSRPVFKLNNDLQLKESERKLMWVAQYQIKLRS